MVAREKDGGKGIVRDFGMDKYTQLYSKGITNKGLWYTCRILLNICMAAWMEEESWGEWIHVYVRAQPCAVHLKVSQHC